MLRGGRAAARSLQLWGSAAFREGGGSGGGKLHGPLWFWISTGEGGRRGCRGVGRPLSSSTAFSYVKNQTGPHGEGFPPHPVNVVETRSLGSVSLPPVSYHHHLQDQARDGSLSALQAETIAYASAQHSTFLADGKTRAGFMTVDGAGVGKGRTIAGVILENFRQGRKKAIWVSKSADLAKDAQRDLRDIGATAEIPCTELRRYSVGADLQEEGVTEGVLFVTYSLLVSSSKSRGSTRLDQIIGWLGGEGFEGVVVLDEVHGARNLGGSSLSTLSSADSSTKATKATRCVYRLQEAMPRARVVYVSATALNSPDQFVCFPRLGLVGENALFANEDAFLGLLTERRELALGACELLSAYLKQLGRFVSRTLSYEDASFRTVDVPLPKGFESLYDEATSVWAAVMQCVALSEDPRLAQAAWGCHQRFFAQMLLAAKVDAAVEEAEEALRGGMCVVIGLMSTGEASLVNSIEAGSARAKRGTARDSGDGASDGEPGDKPAIQCELNSTAGSVLSHFCRTRLDVSPELAGKIECLRRRLPGNPLDQLIDRLGGEDRVAEMTGRRVREVRVGGGGWEPQQRLCFRGEESANNRERDMFQAGEKLVAIISDAASTGTSMHADRGCQNQRRRRHIVMQLPWSADKVIQQMGRSHRANQVSAPEYVVLQTPIGAERRFSAVVAQRMRSLGALTRGDRGALSTDDTSAHFDQQTDFRLWSDAAAEIADRVTAEGKGWANSGREVVRYARLMRSGSTLGARLGKELVTEIRGAGVFRGAAKRDQRLLWKFLNRVAGMRLAMQAELMSLFDERVAEMKRDLDADSRGGGREWGGDGKLTAILVEETTLCVCPTTGAKTRHLVIAMDRGVPFEKARRLLEARKRLLGEEGQGDDGSGFYKVLGTGRYALVLRERARDAGKETYQEVSPNLGWKDGHLKGDDLRARYLAVGVGEMGNVEDHWVRMYEAKEGSGARGGRMADVRHLLAGNVVPYWPLMEEVAKERMGPGKRGLTVRTSGVHLSCGRFEFGQVVHKRDVEAVRRRISRAGGL